MKTEVLVLFLALALGGLSYLALRLHFLKRSLGEAAKQMKRISEEKDANEKLRQCSPDRDFAALLSQVNERLSEIQETRAYYENREEEFRRQISNISHDLRTPLTSVLGYLELLEEEDLSLDERREYMQVIGQRAKALQSLVTQFYDLSRLECGDYPIRLEPVNLHNRLCQSLALFYHDFERAGLSPRVLLTEELPLVLADPLGVDRVFGNLLQNILNHGGHLNRGVNPQDVGGTSEAAEGRPLLAVIEQFQQEGQDGLEGAVVTRFSNPAQGLTQQDIERVFERFYTADQMRTGQSTGLGMTIAKMLLSGMGHSITASLEEAAGGGQLFVAEIRWQVGRTTLSRL